DRGDLRHHAGGQRVAEKDVGVAAERDDALLNPGAAGVVEPDDRRAHLHRQVHYLDDLGGVRLRERSAKDREVLGEGERQTTVDPSKARHHAIAGNDLLGHSELAAAMGDDLVELLERTGIEQKVDALPGRKLAGLALAPKALFA